MMREEPTPPTPLPEGKGEKSTANPSPSKDVQDATPEFPPLPSGKGAGGVGFPRRTLLHLLVLLAFLGLWTWKLLEPNPVPEAVSSKLQGPVRVVAAKGLHACGYAFLTLLAVTLPVPNYWRWFFAGLLALHGAATEIGQTYVPGRVGSVRDVLIDWGGVLLGVLVWRLARNPEPGVRNQKPTGVSSSDS
jgi:VanZ family protein